MTHLQYIGYWPGSVDARGSIAEQRGAANVTKAITIARNPHSGEWGDVSAFALARAAGMRVLMNLPEGDDRYRFDEWAATIRPYADQILAFFIRDEPDCMSGGQPDLLARLLDEVEEDVRRVQSAFPGARAMMTLGCFNALVRPWFRMPAGITDIAIECYHGRGQWAEWLVALEPFLAPAHRVWLMPHAYGPATAPDDRAYVPRADDEIMFEAATIYDYAKTDRRVVGLLPFAWYDGIRDRPLVREYLAGVGREIVEGRVSRVVDRTTRLDRVVSETVMAERPFTVALIGNHFAPRAGIQYSVGAGFYGYPATAVADNVLLVTGPPVAPGRYWLRARNPDGEVTVAMPLAVE